MMEYDIVGIHHVSGIKHDMIDCLSRFPTVDYTPDDDEIQEVPLLVIPSIDFAASQRSDPACLEIITGLTNPALSRLHVNYVLKDEVLYYRHAKQDRNVIVVPQSLQQAILHECHDSPIAAHLGIAKTFERVRRSYWWPQMRKDIVKYVRTCHPCQVRKIQKQKPSGLMQFFEIPEELFSRVQIDVAGPFPTSSRQNKLIITATDYVSKWLESRAVRRADTPTLVKFVVEQIICRHGCPKIIQSDNGSIFTSDFFAAVTEKLGIQHKLSTTFHPQSQGQVERTHAVINDCISMFINQNQTNWCERLHLITFAINTSVSTATGFTPFFLLHGRQARLPSEAQLSESNYADLDSLLDSLYRARALARENIEISQIRNASYYDRNRRENTFKVGDTVVCRKFMRKPGLSSKLTLQYYYGPYQITEMPTEVNAVIEAKGSGGRIIKEKVHVDKLKPYYPRDDTLHEVEIQVPGSEAILDPLLEPLAISDVTDTNESEGLAIIPPINPPSHPAVVEDLTESPDNVLQSNDVIGTPPAQPPLAETTPAITEQTDADPLVPIPQALQPEPTSSPSSVVVNPQPSQDLDPEEAPRYSLRQRRPVNYRN
jgi:hypothetical protein